MNESERSSPPNSALKRSRSSSGLAVGGTGQSSPKRRRAARDATTLAALAESLRSQFTARRAFGMTLRQTFEAMDAARTGHVTVDEFQRGLDRLGLSLGPKDSRRLAQLLDADDEGTISYEQICNFLEGSGAVRHLLSSRRGKSHPSVNHRNRRSGRPRPQSSRHAPPRGNARDLPVAQQPQSRKRPASAVENQWQTVFPGSTFLEGSLTSPRTRPSARRDRDVHDVVFDRRFGVAHPGGSHPVLHREPSWDTVAPQTRRRRVEGAADVSGTAPGPGPAPGSRRRPRRQSARVASLLRSAGSTGSGNSKEAGSGDQSATTLDMTTVAVALLVAARLKDSGELQDRAYLGVKEAIVQHDARVKRVVDEWRTTGDDDRLEQATKALASMSIQ